MIATAPRARVIAPNAVDFDVAAPNRRPQSRAILAGG
jgi:hypothetical protein